MSFISSYNTIYSDINSNYNYIGTKHIFKTINTQTKLDTSATLNSTFTNRDYILNDALTIRQDGNIGIGVTDPKYKLEVNDIVYIEEIIADGSKLSSLNASYFNSGKINLSLIPTSSVISGSYGKIETSSVSIIVDQYGRITSAKNISISNIYATNISGLVASATIDATNASNISIGTLNTNRLPSIINSSFIGNGNLLNNINVSNIIFGSIDIQRFPTITNISGIYGNSDTSVFITVDKYGRIVNVEEKSINTILNLQQINASNMTTGTLSTDRINSNVITSGTYGDSNDTVIIKVDQYGRITSISQTSIKINYSSILGLSKSATIDTTNASNITTGILNTLVINNIESTFIGSGLGINNINASNITIGTINISRYSQILTNIGRYGNTLNTCSITVDNYGRITSISNVAISSITALVTSDQTNASNITIGSINTARYPTLSSIGTYGTSSNLTNLLVDTYGRIISVTNIVINNITLSYVNITGLVTSATIDSTNISNVTSGIINISRLPSIINSTYIGDGYGLSFINASNINFGIINTNVLPIVSSIIPGVYGNNTNTVSITVDTYGRVTNITNIAISTYYNNTTNATNFTSGILNTNRLEPISNLVSGTYGNVITRIVNNSILTIDLYGRITSIVNSSINVLSTQISGLVSSATIDTTNASNINKSGTINVLRLPSLINANLIGNGIALSNINSTNINIGILNISRFPTISNTITNINSLYGYTTISTISNISNTAAITVDQYGRVTNIINVSLISIGNYITNASNITKGTLNINRINIINNFNNRTYGNKYSSTSFKVNQYGIITSIKNTNVYISYTNVNGLSSSATINTTDASNITSGILSNDRLNIINCFHIGDATNLYTFNGFNVSDGIVDSSYFPKTEVISGSYSGDSNTTPVVSIDIYGRITNVSSTTLNKIGDNKNASNITYGTLNLSRYPTLSLPLTTYGRSVTNVTRIVLDSFGRITTISNVTYTVPTFSYNAVRGITSSATINTTNAANITAGSISINRLTSIINSTYLSGDGWALSSISSQNIAYGIPIDKLEPLTIVPGTYGTIDKILQIKVDTYGRVTTIADAIPATTILTGVSNVSKITSGTIQNINFPEFIASGVYGSQNTSFSISFDQYGRISAITNIDYNINSGIISGLSSTANVDISQMEFIGDASAAAITIGNIPQTFAIRGDSIILNSKTNTISFNSVALPIFLNSIDYNRNYGFSEWFYANSGTSTTNVAIPTNFNLNYNSVLEIRLKIADNTGTVSIGCLLNTLQTILPSDHHVYRLNNNATNTVIMTNNSISTISEGRLSNMVINITKPYGTTTPYGYYYYIESSDIPDPSNYGSTYSSLMSGYFSVPTAGTFMKSLILTPSTESSFWWSTINY